MAKIIIIFYEQSKAFEKYDLVFLFSRGTPHKMFLITFCKYKNPTQKANLGQKNNRNNVDRLQKAVFEN